jgi:hypothetical protein
MGLLVDKVKPGGGGTSNDGNTARRFFKNYRESARINCVNEDLIQRFYVILQSISSGFELNIEEFNKYAKDTAKSFVKEFNMFHVRALYYTKTLITNKCTNAQLMIKLSLCICW